MLQQHGQLVIVPLQQKQQQPPASSLQSLAPVLSITRDSTTVWTTKTMSAQKSQAAHDSSKTTDSSQRWFFNNFSVSHVDRHPPVGRVSCVQHIGRSNRRRTIDSLNEEVTNLTRAALPQAQPWLTRTCVYTNLCLDLHSRDFVLFTDNTKHDEDTSDVAIGGINPRWAFRYHGDGSGHTSVDPTASWLQPVRWQPTRHLLSRSLDETRQNNYSTYYQVDDQERVLVLFHSMAGHNVGHLLWDDLYAAYSALRLSGLLESSESLDSAPPSLALMRHVLAGNGTNLFASCDIRRRRRLQCRANLERLATGFGGIDPATVATTKTATLHQKESNQQQQEPTAESPQSSLVCWKKTVVGIGLLTDHGLYDHGWEQSNTLPNGRVPHNLGRGRHFYDFAQFYRRHTLATTATAPAKATPPVTHATMSRDTDNSQRPLGVPPQITFAIRSSRDWARKLDFVAQIKALQSLSAHYDFTVRAYAKNTSIYVTACGGGSMTATFLPRHATLILWYDAIGGLDFVPHLAANHLPARLDADLLNHAAAWRVHWLPVSYIHNETATKRQLFVKLIQHELAILRRISRGYPA
jgi:hypothetical protein